MRISDWSSDVCSSDLRKRSDRSGVRGRAQHRDHGECAGRGGKRAAAVGADGATAGAGGAARGCERRGFMGWAVVAAADRKSAEEGKSVWERLDISGRSINKKTTDTNITNRALENYHSLLQLHNDWEKVVC